MDYFPVFLDLGSQEVLVVGGGAVGERKLRPLIRAGAKPRVVGARLSRTIRSWVDSGAVAHAGESYHAGLLDGMRLVFAATDDPALNRLVFHNAETRGIWVNVVDDREYCRFISPAIVNRRPVQIAISTGGCSPVLARRVRSRVEAALPAGLGRVAVAAGRFRETVKRTLAPEHRRRFWDTVMTDANLTGWAGLGQHRIVRELARLLRRHGQLVAARSAPAGRVYLVGAGPGDPGMLTLRALELLGQADVILHDRLVANEILDLARRDADRIYVGKAAGRHHCSQAEIERTMLREASRGRTVVRLKGGDPFIFGRGGEELEALRREGIECEVVPGVTAAAGCAASFCRLACRGSFRWRLWLMAHARTSRSCVERSVNFPNWLPWWGRGPPAC